MIGRIPRRNKIRLQYNRIRRMHSPPTNGAIDMHWMSYQTEKNTNVYIECVLTRKKCPCENWESTMMSYHTSATVYPSSSTSYHQCMSEYHTEHPHHRNIKRVAV
jgi:hypothetical protein